VAKRETPEEHENHERWLVSYADFITLLFAFFVVLYSTSRIDNKRMVDVVKSIKFAMHFKGQGGVDTMPIFDGPASEGGCQANLSDSERPSQKQIEAVEAMRRRMEKKFKGFLLEKPGLTTAVTLHVEGKKLMVRLSVAHFFDPMQAASGRTSSPSWTSSPRSSAACTGPFASRATPTTPRSLPRATATTGISRHHARPR
jgi:flagellar motor protein MotB